MLSLTALLALCVLNVYGYPYDDPSRAYERYLESKLFDVERKYHEKFDSLKELDTVDLLGKRYKKRLVAVASLTDFDKSCLIATNKYRQKHEHTSPLEYDTGLALEATKWAEYIVQFPTLKESMKHSNIKGQGENLFCGGGLRTCEKAVKDWYYEIFNYDFSSGTSKNGGVIGHFTQTVWKSTTKMGVGIATKTSADGSIKTCIVGRYTPGGNLPGAYTTNVMPLKPGESMPIIPTTPKPTPIPCTNLYTITACTWLVNSDEYGPCNGKTKSAYEIHCRKFCNFC